MNVDGELDGWCNYVEDLRADGSSERHAFATNVEVNTEDVIHVVIGNSGGFEHPANRSAEDLARDLRDEYLTLERARGLRLRGLNFRGTPVKLACPETCAWTLRTLAWATGVGQMLINMGCI